MFIPWNHFKLIVDYGKLAKSEKGQINFKMVTVWTKLDHNCQARVQASPFHLFSHQFSTVANEIKKQRCLTQNRIYFDRTIKVGKNLPTVGITNLVTYLFFGDFFFSSSKAFASAVNDSAKLVSSSDDLSPVFSPGSTELLRVERR